MVPALQRRLGLYQHGLTIVVEHFLCTQPMSVVWEVTGQQLRDLVLQKYGKTYDLSIARREILGKRLVALNVMWTHLEQQSFPMTEAQFMDKMDGIAFYLS